MIRAKSTHSSVVPLMVDILVFVALLVAITLTGCERKEKVLEINTPGAEVNVTKDRDTGRVDVDVRDK